MELRELERMTVVKLREEALNHEGLAGVHGMNKAQLIEALAPRFGIDLEAIAQAARERRAAGKGNLKQEILALKMDRDSALLNEDRGAFIKARKDIKKRKRRLRRLAEQT